MVHSKWSIVPVFSFIGFNRSGSGDNTVAKETWHFNSSTIPSTSWSAFVKEPIHLENISTIAKAASSHFLFWVTLSDSDNGWLKKKRRFQLAFHTEGCRPRMVRFPTLRIIPKSFFTKKCHLLTLMSSFSSWYHNTGNWPQRVSQKRLQPVHLPLWKDLSSLFSSHLIKSRG